MSSLPHHVALAGATGLIGTALLDRMLTEQTLSSVQAPTRRKLSPHIHLSNTVGPLLEGIQALHAPIDTAFCCLGTTMAQAQSEEAFYAVDFSLVQAFSTRARELGARHLLVVSAMGASSTSRFFYNRVKGQMEAMLAEHDWPQLTIARPALLLGHRRQPRLGESLAAPLARFLPGNYKAIAGTTVARALWRLALEPSTGTRVIESAALHKLGQ